MAANGNSKRIYESTSEQFRLSKADYELSVEFATVGFMLGFCVANTQQHAFINPNLPSYLQNIYLIIYKFSGLFFNFLDRNMIET